MAEVRRLCYGDGQLWSMSADFILPYEAKGIRTDDEAAPKILGFYEVKHYLGLAETWIQKKTASSVSVEVASSDFLKRKGFGVPLET